MEGLNPEDPSSRNVVQICFPQSIVGHNAFYPTMIPNFGDDSSPTGRI